MGPHPGEGAGRGFTFSTLLLDSARDVGRDFACGADRAADLFEAARLLAGAILAAFEGPIVLWVCLLALGFLLPLRRG